MNTVMDAVDGLLVRAEAPLLKTSLEGIELRGYLRHRGFLEYVGRGMREETYYRNLVVSAVDSQTTFVDAGAHIGIYTLFTCRRARRVLAFEPDPYNFAALRRNIERAGCTNVEIRPEAVAEQAGDASFRAFRSTFSGSLVHREVDPYRTVDVKMISLDAALDDSDLENLVVKLDIEGAEPQAVAGMRRTIRRAQRVVIFAEVNHEALEAAGYSPEQLIQLLRETDLECMWVDELRRSVVPVREADLFTKGNVVCQRRSRLASVQDPSVGEQ